MLEDQAGRLQAREEALNDKRLRFHSLYELGRCRLREAWQRLRQDQYRWKHRRGKERAALKVRERDVESGEQKLLEAQRLFIKEKRTWDAARAAVHAEAEGGEERVCNLRQRLFEQKREIDQLDAEILARQQVRAGLPELPPVEQPAPVSLIASTQLSTTPLDSAAPSAQSGVLATVPPTPEKVERPTYARQFLALRNRAPEVTVPQASGQQDSLAGAPDESGAAARLEDIWRRRFQDLDRVAGDLADQRLQLVEHWQRLGILQVRWEKDRRAAGRELEELARRLVDRAHALAEREQAGAQAEQVLRQRHAELIQMRQQMIAWRARLRVRDKAWEGERSRLLMEVRAREELAERHLNTLVDLRQRWAKRRRQELEKLRGERDALEVVRKETGQQRLVLADQTSALEAEKRIIAEKVLALEQYRKEFLSKVENPAAERRLERLRCRWVTLNASSIRTATREREAVKTMLETLEDRFGALQQRSDAIAQTELEFIEKQNAWEHKQALAASRQTRIQHELQMAEAQRNLSEQQVARMKEEIERIARALIDEPDPPAKQVLSQAA